MRYRKKDVPSLTTEDIFGASDLSEAQEHVEEWLEDYTRKVKNFRRSYEGKLHMLTPRRMINAIERYHDLTRDEYFIHNRVALHYRTHYSDDDSRALYHAATTEVRDLQTKYVDFFEHELGDLKRDYYDAYMEFRKSDELSDKHKRYILDMQRKPSDPSKESEEAVKASELVFDQIKEMYSQFLMTNGEFSLNGERANYDQVLSEMYSTDGNERKAGYAARDEFFSRDSIQWFITQVFNTVLRTSVAATKMRKQTSYTSEYHKENELEDEDVDRMVGALEKVDTSYRYLKLKAKELGKKKLDYSDVWAAVPGEKIKTYSWDEAKDIITSAFSSFSPEMGRVAKEIFDNNWVDARSGPGRVQESEAFYAGTDDHPWVLSDFTGGEEEMLILAHEMGHAIGMKLAVEEQGNFLSEQNSFVSEICASLGEELFFNEMEKRCREKGDIKQLPILQAKRIERTLEKSLMACTYQMVQTCHEALDEGKHILTADEVSDYWTEGRKKYFGLKDEDGEYQDFAINPKTIPPMGWAGVDYLFWDPFYLSQYPMTKLIVLDALSEAEQGNIKNIGDKFEKFMRKGNTEKAPELLRGLGIDIKEPGYWKRAANNFDKMVDRYEQLLEEAKEPNYADQVKASKSLRRHR